MALNRFRQQAVVEHRRIALTHKTVYNSAGSPVGFAMIVLGCY